ncbi:MAG: 2-succinyl-5-enolpyruvyl-6-hydroxy-3-cyclohexene-1-carboxylic-acid synthase, partial [Lysinibacillus sp.]
LLAQGVKHVVISPGSRSTPLAYAFAHAKDIQVYRQVDERAAGFFAVGLAKASGQPTVLLCTSGTAAANYYPAVVEAKYARVPLVVLTADRPHELREVGAPQAINQVNLYGDHVKWAVDFPIPDTATGTMPFIERHMARAVAISKAAPVGPVHVNIPFREPLLIDFEELPVVNVRQHFASDITPSMESLAQMRETLKETTKGVVVVGELPHGVNRDLLWSFIRSLKWPVLVETLSNFRSDIPEDCKPYVITAYDAFLKQQDIKQVLAPETVIRLGAQPISKFLMQFLAEHAQHYIVVDESPLFRDSYAVTTQFVHATIGTWLLDLHASAIDDNYTTDWQQVQQLTVNEIIRYKEYGIDEGAYVQHLLESVEDVNIFASSSMPIRDMDTFFVPTEKSMQIFANRGANGIDGVVSSAFGFSAASNLPTYLVIGDLATLHDMSGLLATRYQQIDCTIIVMNNDGGGIFSYLPQSKVEAHYEDLFGTPTALGFEQLADMFDCQYNRVSTLEDFSNALWLEKTSGVRIIEVMTNRALNVDTHRALWTRINERLAQWLQLHV